MLGQLTYYTAAIIFCFGIYMIISSSNYFKKVIGLSIFQVGILIFYISLGKIFNALPPIKVLEENVIYSNPLPHVLMLTAIVVGFATLAVALALLLKIYRNFGSLNEDELISK